MVDTAVEQQLFTIKEYLAMEEKSSDKHAFYNGKVIKMAGGTALHSYIISRIVAALNNEVENLDNQFFVLDSNIKIQLEAYNHFVYPDAVVIAEKLQYFEGRKDVIINPLLIVEVLSHSTREHDRGAKFAEYRTMPSFQEYVLVEQTFPKVTTFFQEAEDLWRTTDFHALSDTITLQSLGLSIPMQQFYKGATAFEEFKTEPPTKKS